MTKTKRRCLSWYGGWRCVKGRKHSGWHRSDYFHPEDGTLANGAIRRSALTRVWQDYKAKAKSSDRSKTE